MARTMRSIEIEKEKGIIGKYNHAKKLVVGMTQHMMFTEKDYLGHDRTGPILKDSKFKCKYDVID